MAGERLSRFETNDDPQYHESAQKMRKFAESAVERKWERPLSDKLGELIASWADIMSAVPEAGEAVGGGDVAVGEGHQQHLRDTVNEMREAIPIMKKALELVEGKDVLADALRTWEYQKEIFSLRALIYRNVYHDTAQADHYDKLVQTMGQEMGVIRDIMANEAKTAETQH